MDTHELTQELRERANELGFAAFGVARAEALEPEGEQLRAYLAAGRHGQMGWLENTAEVRIDPRTPGMVQDAVSVVVLAAPYARSSERVGPAPGRIARYARGRDYHNVLSKRLRKLERWLREQGFETRHSVDSRPVLERAWAERAGVGFIGKNSCLIVPGMGSHLFLACLVTCAPLDVTPPMKRRCGDCRLCLDACPTRAFVGPRELDARRCVSYLTIEHDGVIDDELKPGVGDWLLGCDACQDICPYNRTSLPPAEQTQPYAADPRWAERSASDILSMSAEEYGEWAIGTPMRRPGRNRMARNAAIVLGNTRQRVHLPVLQSATQDSDEAVRDAALWAVKRCDDGDGDG